MRSILARIGVALAAVLALTFGVVAPAHAADIAANVVPPQQVDNCGTSNDYFNEPNAMALSYSYVTEADGTITATATAKPGYYIPAGSDTEWSFPAFGSGCVTVSDLPEPVQIDNCGPEQRNGMRWWYWEFPNVEGASYTLLRNASTGTFLVRVDPRPGYQIDPNVTSRWMFPPFTDEPC